MIMVWKDESKVTYLVRCLRWSAEKGVLQLFGQGGNYVPHLTQFLETYIK